jgi:hypothetical protein
MSGEDVRGNRICIGEPKAFIPKKNFVEDILLPVPDNVMATDWERIVKNIFGTEGKAFQARGKYQKKPTPNRYHATFPRSGVSLIIANYWSLQPQITCR